MEIDDELNTDRFEPNPVISNLSQTQSLTAMVKTMTT